MGRKKRSRFDRAVGETKGGGNGRASALQARLALRGASGVHGPKVTGQAGTQDQYEVLPNARVTSIQRNLIGQWRKRYKKGVAEGLSGKDQESLLGSGPRRTLDSISSPLRYSVGGARKTRTQRMIESGDVSGAFANMKKGRGKRAERFLRMDARKLDFDPNLLGVQVGLSHQAKESSKKAVKRRRMDVMTM